MLSSPGWLLGVLNSLAADAGISFDRIEPGEVVSSIGRYHLQEFSIELRAGYHKLAGFINRFENLSPFLKVIDIDIAGNRNDPSNHIVKLKVGAYVSKES